VADKDKAEPKSPPPYDYVAERLKEAAAKKAKEK